MLGVIRRRCGECTPDDAADNGAGEKAVMMVMVVMVVMVILRKLHESARLNRRRRVVGPQHFDRVRDRRK